MLNTHAVPNASLKQKQGRSASPRKASHGHDRFIRNVGGPYHPTTCCSWIGTYTCMYVGRSAGMYVVQIYAWQSIYIYISPRFKKQVHEKNPARITKTYIGSIMLTPATSHACTSPPADHLSSLPGLMMSILMIMLMMMLMLMMALVLPGIFFLSPGSESHQLVNLYRCS